MYMFLEYCRPNRKKTVTDSIVHNENSRIYQKNDDDKEKKKRNIYFFLFLFFFSLLDHCNSESEKKFQLLNVATQCVIDMIIDQTTATILLNE